MALRNKASDKGIRFIGKWEGFRSRLYNDAAGHCTIGFGHLLHEGECTKVDQILLEKGLTEAQGLKLLREDVHTKAADPVREYVRVSLKQHQFDALVSFTFNLGAGSLKRSSLLRKLNEGNYAAVPKEMMKWTKANGKVLPGLVKRREAEAKLFSTGKYS